MAQRITRHIRAQVFARAKGRCEYCHSQALYTTEPFDVEHIFPIARGGQTTLDNLALACSGCNGHKYDRTEARDPESAVDVPLFHPRQHSWNEHFAWSEDKTQVLGLTPIGRATVNLLCMNAPNLINWRLVMRLAGQHPPEFLSSDS